MGRINVTKTFLPPHEEYDSYVQKIWESGWLTNQGPLNRQLESGIADYLGLERLHFVSNGTVALQLALNALGIDGGEVITTPFSYVATTSAILWERCTPVFVDIEKDTLSIDASKIEAAITPRTKAILAVHVFGNPCDTEKIAAIAHKHNLKVIYDGAHAFGATYQGKPLLSYGDISTCSFHSTKPFHTIEGGCVVAGDQNLHDHIELTKRFGHDGDDHFKLGINAKASEFQAAMGLCNLKHIDNITRQRKRVCDLYDSMLAKIVERMKLRNGTEWNYAYYPIIVDSLQRLKKIIGELNAQDIFPRRYFHPSLNTLPYVTQAQKCPVSEDVADRILCLPLYHDLADNDVQRISNIVANAYA